MPMDQNRFCSFFREFFFLRFRPREFFSCQQKPIRQNAAVLGPDVQAIRCKILALGDELNPQHCRLGRGWVGLGLGWWEEVGNLDGDGIFFENFREGGQLGCNWWVVFFF